MYLLTLLFFVNCPSIQAGNKELPVACSSENVSLEEATEHLNVDSFKAALEKSEPGDKVTLMLELYSRKMTQVKEQDAGQLALHTIKNGQGIYRHISYTSKANSSPVGLAIEVQGNGCFHYFVAKPTSVSQ